MTESVQEIMLDMQHSIRCDIHGDIYGHEYWAEEVYRLREQVRKLQEKSVEDSWRLNPDTSGGAYTDEEIARYRDPSW